ncbi:MAG: hypothetical protein HXS47_07475, partial [Theionarchaea archaeon]|nr:hypothetical protein [Theionarchaea archaeon]
FQEDIRDELKTLIKTHEQNLTEFNKKFYEEHGIDVLKIEEKYGFEIAKDAAKSIYELKYFKNNTELLEKIFGTLKK